MKTNFLGHPGATITAVAPGSIADELGLQPGDRLVSINGREVRDLLEYSYLTQTGRLELTVARGDEVIVCDVEKDEDEDLGITFAETLFDGMMKCRNNCVFCFVRQNPPGVRQSLCVRDDDPRLSFLHGNYISLTNLSEDHFNMLLKLRLSPLYVSVHSTDKSIRKRLMGYRRDIDIMAQLSALTSAGITVHCQVVLCPGINDRFELIRTVDDLSKLYPGVSTVAVVPVGLTRYRQRLPSLKRPDRRVAQETVEIVGRLQQRFLDSLGTRFVFASDEFYFLAGIPLPEEEEYEGYQQLDNGVGLTRKMCEEFREILKNRGLPPIGGGVVNVVTGVLGSQALNLALSALPSEAQRCIRILPVENSFFGDLVTVTGLLSGRDILRGVREIVRKGDCGRNERQLAVIPDVVLNSEGMFVDDLTIKDVIDAAAALNVDLRVVPSGAEGLYLVLSAASEVKNVK